MLIEKILSKIDFLCFWMYNTHMPQILDLISATEKRRLLRKFRALKEVCRPEDAIIRPSFVFKNKNDFNPGLDDFHCGCVATGYSIQPDQIKSYFYEDRETLRESYVDFIKAGNLKWYYNTSEINGNFFSEDGQKKVEVNFDFWVDAEKLWSVPGLKQAICGILKKCAGDSFPTQTEAESFFDAELCRRIYNRAPSKKSMKQTIVELIEVLRKALYEELVKSKSSQIVASAGFKKYAKEKNINTSKPASAIVQPYLKNNKNALYLLSEKFGLIKKAARLIHYQNVRDSVRHPAEVKAKLPLASKVYQDFCDILGIPNKKAKKTKFRTLAYNAEVFDNLDCMSEILDIINIYADKKLSKKNPAYWQDLVQKGILDSSELPYLQKMILGCNAVAHVNDNAVTKKRIVANDGRLIEISLNIAERHEKKQQQIHQWIEENSFDI